MTAFKKIIFILALTPIFSMGSNMSQMARKILIQDIENYSNDYGLTELIAVKDLGADKDQYRFLVTYNKDFCKDVGDDSRLYCQLYQCQSMASVSSDGNVLFETDKGSSSCLLIENSNY